MERWSNPAKFRELMGMAPKVRKKARKHTVTSNRPHPLTGVRAIKSRPKKTNTARSSRPVDSAQCKILYAKIGFIIERT